MEKFDVLTAYERRKAKGKKGDKVLDDLELRKIVKSVLNSETEKGTVAEVLTVATINEAIDNPSTAKLKDLMAIAGESLAPIEVKTDSTIKSVNSELEREALGETK